MHFLKNVAKNVAILNLQYYNYTEITDWGIKMEQLTQYLSGETLTIEYKDDNQKSFNDELIIKACVSMANAEGGVILIGVSDDAQIMGSKRAASGNPQALEGMIRERTRPALTTKVLFINCNNKIVVMIYVTKSIDVISTSSGLYLKRQLDSHGKPQNLPMSIDEIIRNTTRLGMTDLSANVLKGTSLEDVNLELVSSTASDILKNNQTPSDIERYSKDPINILKSLGLLEQENKPNIACLLLFGKEASIQNHIPNHFVQYQVFGKTGEILRNEKYYSPITKLFPALLKKPELLRNSNEIILNGRSITIPEYTEAALREAFANAFVHRDYTMHSGIQIQVFSTELKVTSAGGFLDGITINNLLSTPPTPRNRRLSEAMMKLKFVETSGRGIDIIYYSQAKYGRPAPDYSASTQNSVIVRLAGGTANIEFCKYIMSLGTPSLYEMLILNALFYQRSMKLKEISELIQNTETSAKEIMSSLLQKDWVELLDEHNPIYFLKGTLKSTVLRITKANQNEIKNKIIELLSSNEHISRNEIAKILNLTSNQTYRLLSSLQKDGVLKIVGKSWILNNRKSQ